MSFLVSTKWWILKPAIYILMVSNLVLASSVNLFAHGVISTILGKGGIVLESHYTDGETMSYAEVTILAPEKKLPFQSGYTDRNGYFSFIPDECGVWEVVFQDGLGHRSELQVVVEDTKVVSPINHQNSAHNKSARESMGESPAVDELNRSNHRMAISYLPLYLRIFIGFSFIFGFSGIVMMIKAKKVIGAKR